MHVGEHATLRCEPRRIAAGSGRERRNVVGQQTLQIGGTVGTRHGNLLPPRDRPDRGFFPNVAVILVQSHVSRSELIRSRQMRVLALPHRRTWLYLTCALVLALAAPAAAQQAPASVKPTGYTVFLRGAPVGREEVTVQEDATGTTITAQGRMGPPLNVVTRRAEVKYTADGSPERFTLDGSANGSDVSVRTTFANGTAQTEGNQGTAKIATSHPFSPQAVVLPNGVFSLYAALADRLSRVTAGAELKAYILPLAEIGVRVVSDQPERIQVGTSFLDVQRYDLLFSNPGGDLAVSLTAGDGGRLIRLSIPAQAIEVVREDVASPTSRTQVFSNPGDEAVVIPAVGFNLGATITKPSSAAAPASVPGSGAAGRVPAVILLSRSDGGRLIRLSIPAQAIEVVREDVASPTSRTQVFSNPGDEAVVIPAVGFNLGATITKPSSAAAPASVPGSGAAGRVPAVILLS